MAGVQNSKLMTESQLVNTIIEELLYSKIFCWRTNNTPTYDAKRQVYRSMPKFAMHGVPDISGVLPDGRALFIEVKLPKGKLSTAQQIFLARAGMLGALAFEARSPQDVHRQLLASGYGKQGKFIKSKESN